MNPDQLPWPSGVSQVLGCLALAFSIYFTIRPYAIPWYPRLRLDMSTAPLVSLCFVGIWQLLTGDLIIRALVGNDTFQPYSIVLLFLSLAYLCLSLDQTGILAYIAHRLTQRAQNQTKKLFLMIFFLSSLFTVFTSNDIVILTLTPMICHFNDTAPNSTSGPHRLTPFLLIQFMAANTLSTIFYFSNATNLIVTQAFQIQFVEYAKWMVLPTLAGGLTLLGVLWYRFSSTLNQSWKRSESETRSMDSVESRSEADSKLVQNWSHAGWGVFVLVVCLVAMVIAPWLPWPLYWTTLGCAAAMFLADVVVDWKHYRKQGIHSLPSSGTLEFTVVEEKPKPLHIQVVADRMPWSIVPFVLSMFILVEVLNTFGLVAWLAKGLVILCADNEFCTVLVMTVVSSLACNIMNNQPMTILFTAVLQDPAWRATYVKSIALKNAAIYGVIMGSNFGANLTFIGALAGIMWNSILQQFHIEMKAKEFTRHGVVCMIWVILVSSTVLTIELYTFPA